jgi:hypothetical protein
LRRLGSALTALGEAHFFFAEQARVKVSASRLPALRSLSDRASGKRDLKDALDKRSRAIEDASAQYINILTIQPSPPPKWVVAGAAQVAGMWGDLADELRALAKASKPAAAKAQAIGVHTDIEEARKRFFERARAAALTCSRYSVKFQHASEHSRRCDQWLIENTPKEHPRIEELSPGYGFVRQGAMDPGAPAAPRAPTDASQAGSAAPEAHAP